VSCCDEHPIRHDELAEALPAVAPVAVVDGKTHPVWQIDACELQFIMHLVVVEDCAKRIFPAADAAVAAPAIAITVITVVKHRICASQIASSHRPSYRDTGS
jgi:hypothetical protein